MVVKGYSSRDSSIHLGGQLYSVELVREVQRTKAFTGVGRDGGPPIGTS